MRKRSIRKTVRSGTNDRLRLVAYEIHDGLCQQLAASLGYLEAYDEMQSRAPEQAEEFFRSGMEVLRAAMEESRELVSRLRDISGTHPHLVEAINQLIHESHWSDDIEVVFHHDVPRDALTYTEFNAAFRIIQESLTNVARHSKSQAALVDAVVSGHVLRIRVEDHGAGFNPANVEDDHFGIEGMRLRAVLAGGCLDIESRPGFGSCVRAEIPLRGNPLTG